MGNNEVLAGGLFVLGFLFIVVFVISVNDFKGSLVIVFVDATNLGVDVWIMLEDSIVVSDVIVCVNFSNLGWTILDDSVVACVVIKDLRASEKDGLVVATLLAVDDER